MLATALLVAYNYCTLSYTMAFWSQAEWEKELDRLEAHGFNVALVTAGLPKVWQETLREMGYDEKRIRDFIPDGAAAAWWNMGNLEGLGKPVSQERIDKDAELGRWLCAEMRKRGIEPILQGFTGLVPYGTDDSFDQGMWCGIFRRPSLLNPKSGRFDEFARTWYRNLVKVYGIEPKYLGGDLFHEGGGTEELTLEEITEAVRKVQRLQQEAFAGVTWVVQSWQGSPRVEVRAGLDPRHTLIEVLDKDMSNHGEYNYQLGGLPWVWCEVMNFGGNTGLYGGAERFKTLDAVKNGKGKASFRGFGMLSEGLETNAYCYYLFLKGTRGEKGTAGEFVKERYGVEAKRLEKSIEILEKTVWNCPRRQEGCVENVMCAHPAWRVDRVTAWGPTNGIWYARSELVEAAKGYLESYRDDDNFRNDMVEVFMQLLADKARELLPETRCNRARQQEFLDLILLADRLADCSDNWRLAAKESRCREQAGAAGVMGYRRMITYWAETPLDAELSGLEDYAHRSYAGVLRDYYYPRWKAFFERSEEGGKADFVRKDGVQGDLKAVAKEVLEAVE